MFVLVGLFPLECAFLVALEWFEHLVRGHLLLLDVLWQWLLQQVRELSLLLQLMRRLLLPVPRRKLLKLWRR